MFRTIRKFSCAVPVVCALVGAAAAQQSQPGTVSLMPFASTPLSGSELLYIIQGGLSKKITSGVLLGQVAGLAIPATTAVLKGSGTAGVAVAATPGTDFIAPGTAAGGDLSGTFPNPTVTNGGNITNASIPTSGLVSAPAVNNLLPNPQNQLFSNGNWYVKYSQAGTGQQSPAYCTSFETTNSTPTFTCTGTTYQVKVGDIVYISISGIIPDNQFWGYNSIGYVAGCANWLAGGGSYQVQCVLGTNSYGVVAGARVVAVTPNVSITLESPFPGGAVSPASSFPVDLVPIEFGDAGTGLPYAFDGWGKTGSLIVGADDFSANSYPGTTRPLFLQKGAGTSEYYFYKVPQNQLGVWRGRTVSCGIAVKAPTTDSSGTGSLNINDSSASSFSSTFTKGSAYSYYTATQTIATNATSVIIQYSLSGANGDIYYIAGPPTCAFTSSLTQAQLSAPTSYKIRAYTHWNMPLFTPYQFPFQANTASCGGNACWQGLDIEALSVGIVDHTISGVDSKWELETANVGAYYAIYPMTQIGLNQTGGDLFLTFGGPQCVVQVANVQTTCGGVLDLYSTDVNQQGYATFGIFSPTGVWTPTFTIDSWNVYSGGGTFYN